MRACLLAQGRVEMNVVVCRAVTLTCVPVHLTRNRSLIRCVAWGLLPQDYTSIKVPPEGRWAMLLEYADVGERRNPHGTPKAHANGGHRDSSLEAKPCRRSTDDFIALVVSLLKLRVATRLRRAAR